MSKELKHHFFYIFLASLPIVVFLIPDYSVAQIFNEKLINFLTYLPYLFLVAIGFLGFRLNQTRVLAASLIFLLSYHCLLNPEILMSLGIGKIRLRQILSLGAPIGITLLFIYKEAPLQSLKTLIRFCLGFLPLIIFAAVFALSPATFQSIVSFKIIPIDNNILPHLSFFSIAFLVILSFAFKDNKIKPFLMATLFSFIALYTASYVGMKNGVSSDIFVPNNVLSFVIISIILGHSLYQMYWQRVYIDELTAIANRRALDEKLYALSGEYAVAMIDIDRFKNFNDTYGHDEGDNVLRLVAKTLEGVLGDKVFRYGGEEFCALFRGFDEEDAYVYANKARRKLEEREFFIRTPGQKKKEDKRRNGSKGKKVKVTISIGLASPGSHILTPAEVIKKADTALYAAKEAGRNCVKIAKK